MDPSLIIDPRTIAGDRPEQVTDTTGSLKRRQAAKKEEMRGSLAVVVHVHD